MEPKGQVVKAMVLIRRPSDGALLVSEGASPSGERFHRPLGGHVEFGERARDTARREAPGGDWPGADGGAASPACSRTSSDGPEPLSTEIVFVFTAGFADQAAYEIGEQTVRDALHRTRVIWRAAEAAIPPLYPEGVADLAAGCG